MLFHIVQLFLGEQPRSHVFVLDTVIGKKGGGLSPVQFHGPKIAVSLLGQGVVAGQQPLQLRQGQASQMLQKQGGVVQQGRARLWREEVPLHPHLLGWGDEQLHRLLPSWRFSPRSMASCSLFSSSRS